MLSVAVKPQGGRLMGKDIQKHIKETYGVNYHVRNIYYLMKGLNIVWITSRSKHPKQDLAAQEAFKKFLIEAITLIPGHVALNTVDICFEDETQFGQQNTTTKVWAEKGSRPSVITQQQFISAHIYGAICPATGKNEALISPVLSMEILQLIANATAKGRSAIVIMDRASWHSNKTAIEFDNLAIIPKELIK
ncbi:MAG: hypothetical protein ACI9RZ_000697 [Sphingobacteriales bacterium]